MLGALLVKPSLASQVQSLGNGRQAGIFYLDSNSAPSQIISLLEEGNTFIAGPFDKISGLADTSEVVNILDLEG